MKSSSGSYDKHHKKQENGLPSDPAADLTEEISEEEKQEILSQIEAAVAKNTTAIDAESISSKPEKKDYFFPTLVNIIALTSIVSITLIGSSYFNNRQVEMVLEAKRYRTTEAKILETYKEESEKQLQEKDAAIYGMLQQLEEFDYQRRKINRLMEINLLQKNQALKRAEEAELELERARLASAGASEPEITAGLAKLAERLDSERTEKLQGYHVEMVTLVGEGEKAQSGEQDLISELNAKAAREKEQLLREIAERETALREELVRVEADSREEIRGLETLREGENSFTHRLNGLYSAIIDKIENLQFQSAGADLTALSEILLGDSVDDLPAVARRREVDLAIISALREFISERRVRLEQESELKEATNELRSRKEENALMSATLKAGERVAALLQDALAGTEGEIVRLKDSQEAAEGEIALMRAAIRDKEREFEQLKRRLEAAPTEATVKAEVERAALSGRDSTLEDLRQFIDNYSKLSSEERQKSAGASQPGDGEDELFKRVTGEILALVDQIRSEEETRAAHYKFLGMVALVSADSITIESFVDVPVEIGSRVEVRHVSAGGDTTRVAVGTIYQKIREKLTAEITSRFGNGPSVRDRIYVETAAE